MRLIDADTLYEVVKGSQNVNPHENEIWHRAHIQEHDHFLYLINMQETIDAVKMVHAKWEDFKQGCYNYRCSNCKMKKITFSWEKSPFCSECGARMDRKEND